VLPAGGFEFLQRLLIAVLPGGRNQCCQNVSVNTAIRAVSVRLECRL
jgi:hypothetical protein